MKHPLLFLRRRGFSTLFLIAVLFLTCAAYIATQHRIENIPRKRIPGSSIIYIPSGKYLKLATFGNSDLAADLIYLWAIQYYSDTSIADRFAYLDRIFSIISELDPHYLDPYQTGALIAIYEAKDFDLGFELLDRGLIHNPKQWILPFEAGHYAQLVMKDYRLAQYYYKKTMEVEGAPPIARRLYANAAFMSMDFQTSWNTWLEVYEGAREQRIKKIASNHLYQVKAAVDIEKMKETLEKYREKYERNPARLEELVDAGLLESLPKDFDGQDYLYDSQTGEVKPATIPWKR